MVGQVLTSGTPRAPGQLAKLAHATTGIQFAVRLQWNREVGRLKREAVENDGARSSSRDRRELHAFDTERRDRLNLDDAPELTARGPREIERRVLAFEEFAAQPR